MTLTYLEKRLKSNTVPHALLFAGISPEQEVTVLNFAKGLLNVEDVKGHPDLYCFSPEGKSGLHSIESLKQLKDEVFLPPYASLRKVFVIWEAERMAQVSANALLKTLEEPLSTSYFILVSSYPEKLLPTIKSRCQILYFPEIQFNAKSPSSLLSILQSLREVSYPELIDSIQKLVEEIETQSHVEKDNSSIEYTAQQKQALEKSREGQEALILHRLTRSYLVQILSWFRDIHLLHLNGSRDCLVHSSEAASIQQWVEKGIIPSLQSIENAVQQAERSIERAVPLRHVFESLFIALKAACFAS